MKRLHATPAHEQAAQTVERPLQQPTVSATGATRQQPSKRRAQDSDRCTANFLQECLYVCMWLEKRSPGAAWPLSSAKKSHRPRASHALQGGCSRLGHRQQFMIKGNPNLRNSGIATAGARCYQVQWLLVSRHFWRQCGWQVLTRGNCRPWLERPGGGSKPARAVDYVECRWPARACCA